jgi:hypothetical protein
MRGNPLKITTWKQKYLQFSEENGDDGRFYNRSNLQVPPKNAQNPFLFFF